MIEVRKQSKDENLMHGDNFPITVCIGTTCKYLTKKAFEELKTKLNTFAIPDVVSRSEQLHKCDVDKIGNEYKCIICGKKSKPKF